MRYDFKYERFLVKKTVDKLETTEACLQSMLVDYTRAINAFSRMPLLHQPSLM